MIPSNRSPLNTTTKSPSSSTSNKQQSLSRFITRSPSDRSNASPVPRVECESPDHDNSSSSALRPSVANRLILDSDEDKENLPTPKFSNPVKSLENNSFDIKENLKVFSPLKDESFTDSQLMNYGESNVSSPIAKFKKVDASITSTDEVGRVDNYLHNRLKFLTPEFIKDAFGNPPNHPDYDPKSLYVPKSFMSSLTPTMKQWWEVKSKYFNSILFFKLGKFYELYHMDADIGVKELDLIYMRGESAHAGFPEISFPRFADVLIKKGYSVARVEQLETPDKMSERLKKKIGTNCIERGVCQVSSQETRTFSPIESIYDMSGGPLDDRRSLLMAFAIKNLDISSKKNLCFGMAVVDTSSSKLTLSQFVDDSYFSRLRTFLSIYNVKKIIVESSSLNPALKSLFKSFQCIIETLRRSSEFPSSPQDAVQKFLASSKLKPTDIPGPLAHRFEYLSESSYKVKVDSELAITSLGALSWYLGYHKIDEEIFAMKNFHDYLPIDSGASDNIASSQTHMVMDSAVIQSLSLISSEDTKPAGNAKRSKSNSLLDVIDFTQSFKGKDIIKKWLIYPLYKYEDIVRRQEIIRHLIKCEIIDRVDFKMLPNYTRLLSVANSLAAKSHDHPEYQAVLFCLSTINKRKANILLLLLNGFMDLSKKFEKLKSDENICLNDNIKDMIYSFPDFLSKIEKILSSFDVEKALDQGLIIPNEGYFEEYDISNQQVEEKLDRLQEYLAEQRKHFPGIPIEYSSGQSKFDLEITNIKESTKLPHDYILVSQTKNLKRFTTQELKKLKFELDKAKQLKEETLQNSTKLIFTQFMSNKSEWEASVDLLGEIDALFSLAKYSRGDRYSNIINMCQPKFHSPNEKTERSDNYIQIFNSFHPQMICSNTNVVPNNIFLNCNDFSKPLLLLTGPNMGGKSTLMRQTAQLVILSQIGCYLPAEKMNIGLPIDRIFVRIGANDSLITGQSTFMTEMSETSIILQHSTRNSLVIIDELGRGTSTFDGVSIAMSVAKELSQNISCMTLFSTHYHDLVFNMSNCEAKIAYGHMNCITTGQADCGESDNKLIDKQNNSMLQDIVFLYKLVQGVCPKSYGFNAAKIAGIPEEIIMCGIEKAKEMEKCQHQLQKFWRIFCQAKSIKDIQSMIQSVNINH